MTEPAQKCEKYAIFKQNYILELFITLKIVYSCCFGLRGNLDFPDFLQKKFYNINYRPAAVSPHVLPKRTSRLGRLTKRKAICFLQKWSGLIGNHRPTQDTYMGW